MPSASEISDYNVVCIFHLRHVHPPWFHHPNNITVRVQIMEHPIRKFNLSLFGPNILLNILFPTTSIYILPLVLPA
jgi:hypothetical protein